MNQYMQSGKKDGLNILVIIGYILLIVPLFEPESLQYLYGSAISTIYSFFKMGSVCIIALNVLLSHSRIGTLTVCSILLVGSVLIATVFDDFGSLKEWIAEWIPFLAIVLLMQSCKSRYLLELLWAFLFVFSSLSIVNFISIILHPEGLYQTLTSPMSDYFFWGNRNLIYQIVLPSVTLSFVLDGTAGKTVTVRSALLLTIGLLQIALAYSATTLIAIIVFVIIIILTKISAMATAIISGAFIPITYGCSFLAIVVFRVQESFATLIAAFTGRTLSRSMTLSGRTDIWDLVFTLMNDSERFLIGYGASSNRYLIIPWLSKYPFSHAHNQLLNVWLCGGTIGLVLFIVLIIVVSMKLAQSRHTITWAPIMASFSSFLIISLAEPIVSPSFGVVVALAFYAETIAHATCGR